MCIDIHITSRVALSLSLPSAMTTTARSSRSYVRA